jgi:3D (Asp-Asp-Asp) domain-containing protein
MYRKIAVLLIALAALGGLAKPGAITKADENPVTDAIASLPSKASDTIVQMRITAYSSSPDETDYNPEYTASGLHVRDGLVASNLFPFGTQIQIPALFGSKVFTIEDRMSKRFQRTIDIWMPSKEKALVFGVAHTKVIVLGNVPLASFNPPAKGTAAVDINKEITANLK